MIENCPKCEQLNSTLIEIDDWELCEGCMKEVEDFLKSIPPRYLVYMESNEMD